MLVYSDIAREGTLLLTYLLMTIVGGQKNCRCSYNFIYVIN